MWYNQGEFSKYCRTGDGKSRKEINMEDETLDQNLEQELEQEPVKTFTQEEVNQIVEQRLARAKKPDDYDDFKELLAELEEYGYPQTAKEAKEALKLQKEQAKAERDLERLEDEATAYGASPELLKKIEALEKEVNEYKSEKTAKMAELEAEKKKAEEQAAADKAWEEQLDELTQAHADIDIEKLNDDAKFLKFVKGKKGRLLEIYEDYLDFIGDTEAQAVKKAMSKAERSTSSGKSQSSAGSGLLSGDEKEVLKDWNRKYPHLQMTEKEWLSYKGR